MSSVSSCMDLCGIKEKLEVFQTKCLRCVLKIYWPNVIQNGELLKRLGMFIKSETIKKTLLTLARSCAPHAPPPLSLPRVALRWTPRENETQADQRRSGPGAWRRTFLKDLKAGGLTWQSQMEVPWNRLNYQTAQRVVSKRASFKQNFVIRIACWSVGIGRGVCIMNRVKEISIFGWEGLKLNLVQSAYWRALMYSPLLSKNAIVKKNNYIIQIHYLAMPIYNFLISLRYVYIYSMVAYRISVTICQIMILGSMSTC